MACSKLGCVKWLNGCAVSTRWRMPFTNLQGLQARDLSGHNNTIAPVPRVPRKEKETSLLPRQKSLLNKVKTCYSVSKYISLNLVLLVSSQFLSIKTASLQKHSSHGFDCRRETRILQLLSQTFDSNQNFKLPGRATNDAGLDRTGTSSTCSVFSEVVKFLFLGCWL